MTTTTNPTTYSCKGVTYNVVGEVMTTDDMRRDNCYRAADDFERRGILGMVTLVRPKGRKVYTGYLNRKMEVFSVDPTW